MAMKRITVAALLAAFAFPAFAQSSPEIPKPKCEPKPEYPGRLAMQSESRRRLFERELKAYKECMQGYVDQRKAAASAEAAAGNQAIEDYNAVMKKINADQEAARELDK
jgi:hypothetical protein